MNAAMLRRAIAAAMANKTLRGAAKHGGNWVKGALAGKIVGGAGGAGAGYLSADEDASAQERLARAGVGAALGVNFGGVAGGSIAVAPAAMRAMRQAVRRTGNAGPISSVRRRRRP